MKRHITTMIAAAAISLIMAVPAMADWAQVSTNVWQWTENGVAVKDKWVTTQNGLYYINLDGNCSYGWINWCGNWYYGEPSGANLGNVVRNNWAQIDNSYYYFFEDGRMATGTQVIGGVTYTFDANGHCTTTPAGVNILTFSATPAVVSGGSGVYYGGGSSSGGSSSGGGHTMTEEEKAQQAAQTMGNAVKENIADMNAALGAGKGSVTGVSTSGKTVTVAVTAPDINDTAELGALIDAADNAIDASGVERDNVETITFNSFTATNIEDAKARVNEFIGSLGIETVKAMYPNGQTVTVNMKDGSVMKVVIALP